MALALALLPGLAAACAPAAMYGSFRKDHFLRDDLFPEPAPVPTAGGRVHVVGTVPSGVLNGPLANVTVSGVNALGLGDVDPVDLTYFDWAKVNMDAARWGRGVEAGWGGVGVVGRTPFPCFFSRRRACPMLTCRPCGPFVYPGQRPVLARLPQPERRLAGCVAEHHPVGPQWCLCHRILRARVRGRGVWCALDCVASHHAHPRCVARASRGRARTVAVHEEGRAVSAGL
jgi:hypothetical protein